MSYEIISIFGYTVIFISLIITDYVLGNGVKNMVCAIVNNYVSETMGTNGKPTFPNIRLLLTEVSIIIITTLIINSLKKLKPVENTNIDELLIESHDMLDKTNQFLEKLRHLRTELQNRNEQNGIHLEVPVLRMAIFDSQGTHNPERGEAGDANFMESTILSMTSLVDDDTLSEMSEKSTLTFTDKPIEYHGKTHEIIDEDC